MSDLHWACEHCGHHLAIDEKGVGRRVVCTNCRKQGVVPPVGSHWFCTECRHKLGAALNLVGKTVHCDECGAEQTVPNPGKTTGAIKIDLSTFSKHAKGGTGSATTVICPKCGAKLPIGATICTHCMFNLSLSEKATDDASGSAMPHKKAKESDKPERDWKEISKVAGLILVILLMGGRLMGDRLAFWRRSPSPVRMLAVEHLDYMRVFDYLQTLKHSMDMGGDLDYAFFLAPHAMEDLNRIGADPVHAGSLVLEELKEVLPVLENYRRLWVAARDGTRIRGSEASDLVRLHPELSGHLRGSGSSATLDAQSAARDLERAARMAVARGIHVLAR